MLNIDKKVEAWKNKLLDLGKRNRLLNYRETKRSSLKILIPDCFKLWDCFVRNEKSLIFQYIDYRSENDGEAANGTSYGIKTEQNMSDMQKTLRNLRDKAKTVTEEQGVNVLYLSFGFLKWNEAEHSDFYFCSPIILVPVTLTVESITSPYILSLHEDEIVINPTLIYKLENDFGITLPEFDEDCDIKEYFASVQKLITHNKWAVLEDTGLSLLSFLKINMYNDLEKHKEAIISNSIVQTISGNADASNAVPEEINDFDYDTKIKPVDTFQVVDADSSQQDALLCAKKGISFVLQGPPGTGKSQTITNIIAECLADGRKVLFVSEKMAALEVVHRRLTNAGLDDFCLILHSYKANKRDVLDQLGKVLSLAKKKAIISDEAYQKLGLLLEDKQKLNDYADQIYIVVMPLGKSIFEVNGILAGLQYCEEIIFTLNNVAETTSRQYNRYIFLLSQFTDTIGKMSDDYKHNPWNGANVSAVTNELRHDVGAKLNKLIPKISGASELFNKIRLDLSLDYSSSYNALTKLIELLKIASESPEVPVSWITGSDIQPLFDEVSECEDLKAKYKELQSRLTDKYQFICSNDSNANFSSVPDLINSAAVNAELLRLRKHIESNNCYKKWNTVSDYGKVKDICQEAKSNIRERNSIISGLSAAFEKEIFSIDYNGIFKRFKTEYTSVFKVFKRTYKADKKQIQGLYKIIVKKVTDEMILSAVNQLRRAEELRDWIDANTAVLSDYFGGYFLGEKTDFNKLDSVFSAYEAIISCLDILFKMKLLAGKEEQQETALTGHYQFMYHGIDTEWKTVRSSLVWAVSFRQLIEKYRINKEFAALICSDSKKILLCGDFAQKIRESLDNVDAEFDWYLSLFDDKESIKNLEMPALLDKTERCLSGLALLEEWIDFRTARESCKKEGLSDYISINENLHFDTSLIIPVFKKRFFRLWLDAVLPNYPSVLNFRRRMHEGTISEFSALDTVQFEIAKARIRSRLINDLPSLDHFTSGVDEISILKRELGKQRRIMPIRRLFREIPNLLLTLKPCLMMSPLSVSLFLEAESYTFDTVIFDEASQVCTENAIGAISRGKQVIIAGDCKQLPPTNFFNAAVSDTDYDTDDDDEDENEDTDVYESILDEAGLLPERTLLWHYRSRHEHLIAFSNAKIYKNNLITFPSNIDKAADIGVEYIYVKEGFYDRGGKKGNIAEAKKVAEMVFSHFRKYPKRSLGVIAFGEVQQQAIDTAIREIRIKNQQYEPFFKDDAVESFFIKNLENVQGDERDTIIFSIGYAKDAAGVFYMIFGPLGKKGGERRLNVAITRAKYNVKLVGSIMPADIDIERISADGPKLLRSYIDFAINGVSTLAGEMPESETTGHNSPFEEAIYKFLDSKGYKIGIQVGCSGYRIDMAVKHPAINSCYVLGIECDGAAYHSARTARERDRLRRDVLENMGWKIYRIWSADWIKDPLTEGAKLTEAIDEAIKSFGTDDYIEADNQTEDEAEDFFTFDQKGAEQTGNPYGFGKYSPTDLSLIPRDSKGFIQIADCIKAIVENEFPIHYEPLCQKLAYLYDNEKVTVKVKREVDYALNLLHGKVIRKDDFLFPEGYTGIIVKMPNSRKINHISVEELAKAMCIIAGKCVGANRESLCSETARAYGFNRSTQNISAAMNDACDMLLAAGTVKEIEGKIII